MESETASLEGWAPDDYALATFTDDQNSLAAPRTALWAQDAVSGTAAAAPTQHLLSFDRANVRSLRRVSYLDLETKKRFKFLTNNSVCPH